MIEHRNVINFMNGAAARVPITHHSTILCLTTVSFDIFVVETLLPLTRGMCVVMAGGDEQKDACALTRLIRDEQVDILQITPSHLKALLSNGGKEAGLLDLLRILIVGAEPFPAELLGDLREVYIGKLYNIYGPTETTVWSTVRDMSVGGNIDIGSPIANTRVYILDNRQRLVPIGVPGELYIGGEGVARGYWANEVLTNERFLPDPLLGAGRVYRTGDRVRWLPDGNIDFLGRADYQVKIRGYRIELGEIEHRLKGLDGVKDAVVTIREKAGERFLVAYYVPAGGEDLPALRDRLSAKLPGYMVPAYFVRLSRLPLTPNGKLDRKALPEPEIGRGAEYIAADGRLEEQLLEIWSEVLKMDRELIGMNSSFFELGGHSLKAIALVNRIGKQLGVTIPLKKVFEHKDIRSLAGHIGAAGRTEYSSIRKAEKKEYYALSSAQRDMYLLSVFNKDSTEYNQPRVVEIDGELSTERLERAFRKLIQRHDLFRTSFQLIHDEPVQRVHGDVDFSITFMHAAGNEVRPLMEAMIRPFDLSRPPLLRVGLVSVDPSKHYLLVDTPHIILDGTSTGILTRELTMLYSGEELQEAAFQYTDFAEWQNSRRRQKELEGQKRYWIDQFAGEIPVLELPRDPVEDLPADYIGGATDLMLPPEHEALIRGIAAKERTSLFGVLLAMYDILLSKLSAQDDIVVGTVVAGRENFATEDMLGMFVVDVPLRAFPKGDLRFTEFLQQVRTNALRGFENQSYHYKIPFYNPGVEGTVHNSFYNAAFLFPNFENAESRELPGLSLTPYDPGGMVDLRYDLTLVAFEQKGRINLRLCTNRYFLPATRQRFADCFAELAKEIATDPDRSLASIRIVPAAEQETLLRKFNNTGKHIRTDKDFAALFGDVVRRTPLRTAVEHNGVVLTYQQLYDKSRELAAVLQANGAAPGVKVALFLPRNTDMLVAILAIFQCGAVYVPLDIHHPAKRGLEILTDSETEIVIVNGGTAQEAEPLREAGPALRVIVNLAEERTGSVPPLQSVAVDVWNDLAYILYTSGTTGKPKGVMIPQIGMINHLYAKIHDLGLTGEDVIAQTASLCFDISIWQCLAGLLTGGRTFIIDTEKVLRPDQLIGALRTGNVTVFESVPSLIITLLEQLPEEFSLPELRWMIPTGETLNASVVRKWYAAFPGIRMLNAYGPTEASDDVTHGLVPPPSENMHLIPIGRPVQNIQVYVLDRDLNLCPIGVRGEICIAGLGVGKGYWKNEEATKKAFIPNPVPGAAAEGWYGTVYRTGDVGYFTPEGEVVCLGRIDHQMKIRGFRIEPSEVEHMLLQHEQVIEVAVLGHDKGQNDKRLAAFVVLADTAYNTSGLKDFLKERVPEYMVPSSFVKLSRMPLTGNGKTDRKALLSKLSVLDQSEENYVQPVTETEKQLAEIWKEVLGVENVGLNDKFFNLGGHSLLLIKSNQRIREKFEVELPFLSYFNRTLEDIAGEINTIIYEKEQA